MDKGINNKDKTTSKINKEQNIPPISPNTNEIQKNSTSNNESTNKINDENLMDFQIELKNISKTGDSKYSWLELRPYIIYFYQKNVEIYKKEKKENYNSFTLFPEKKENKEDNLDLINESHSNSSIIDDKHLEFMSNLGVSNEKKVYDNDINEKDIIEFINKINIMPFTIQRISELLIEPKKYYSSLGKYNRAFYKLVNADFY